MNRDATALEIRDVSVLYGTNRVLDCVALNTASGEFIALLGASGCGKTTLLRAICGFVPVAGGSIAVGGRDITRLRDCVMRTVRPGSPIGLSSSTNTT